MAKTYKDFRDNVRSNPERAARVKTRRQAMEDALALAEIREKRELTQTDIAQVLEMSRRTSRASSGSRISTFQPSLNMSKRSAAS